MTIILHITLGVAICIFSIGLSSLITRNWWWIDPLNQCLPDRLRLSKPTDPDFFIKRKETLWKDPMVVLSILMFFVLVLMFFFRTYIMISFPEAEFPYPRQEKHRPWEPEDAKETAYA